jgi:hypothetical protein
MNSIDNLRPKEKTISSPEQLWDYFEKYKKWAHEHPWNKKDFIRSGENAGTIIDLPIDRPLTEWGFAVFLGISRRGLINYGNMKGYEPYFHTYARIKDEMSEQRISGGMSGIYNANLVARIDGIVEKSATEISGSLKVESPVKWTLPSNGMEKDVSENPE